ncbi:hypothetical protein HYV84_02580 [Candidatus Woesearchaeota archaeon]|nr:hypothetical protein [Candidatus Woesearchaeota archaeon]
MLSRVAPLKQSFFAASIIGLLISGFYLYGKSKSWGFTFMLLFGLMFIASFISMTYSPVMPELEKKR